MEEQNWIRGPIIGRGSTATVSLGITNSGDFFAVKSAEFSSSAFLQREQSILSKLSSPYIVKYIGSNVTKENDKLMYNLLMEYVSGGSLHDLIKNSGGKLPEPLIRSYTRQILKGLMYLHDQGIVHCDVKSQNVMIGGEIAKIVDLGCAKTVEENENLEFSGTPAFMSPEVARGEEQSFPADVWALGCTVIEMATGSSPWPELNDVVAAIYKIGFTGESPVIPVWLSEKGQDFLRKCLRKDPKQRWTVEELLQHPFLDEEDNDSDQTGNCLNSSSPSTVLDQRFWDLCETSRSRFIKEDHEDPFANSTNFLWDDDSLPGDRIKKLAGDESSGEPDWETNGWIEVRGEIEKRNEEEDENCVEATSLEEDEEEVGGFENWIWDQQDSLFLEYSPEDNIYYFYSYYNIFDEDIILYYDHLEDCFVLKFDDNNKKIFFFSHKKKKKKKISISILSISLSSSSMASQASLLLQKQLKDLCKHPVDGFSAGLVDEKNIFEWSVTIIGPPDTLYEGGFFNAIMTFPQNYPNSPPTVRFTSDMWHPNVYSDGRVCISILHPPGDDPSGYELASERWTPVHTVESIMLSIISMLSGPNDESPANVEAAKEWRDKRDEFKKKVSRCVRKSQEMF